MPRILDYARNRHDVDVEDMTGKMWIMTDEGLRSVDDIEEEDDEEEAVQIDTQRYSADNPAQLKFVPSTPLFALDVRHGDSESRK